MRGLQTPMDFNKYRITDPLITEAIYGSYHTCRKSLTKNCNGYVNNDIGEYGRAILEFLAASYFHIVRFPGSEPYYWGDSGFYRDFYGVTRESISAALDEFDKMYRHVQNELSSSDIVKDGKIHLVRALRHVEEEAILPQISAHAQKILMPANILTSYAHDGRLNSYNSDYTVIRDVETEKIFFYDDCFEGPDSVCCHSGEAEVWVLNDDVFGAIELPPESFYDRAAGAMVSYTPSEKADDEVHFRAFPSSEPSLPKPCEYNNLTRWLIERNEKKIRELYGL